LLKSQQKYGPGRKWRVFPKRYWDAHGLKVETEITDSDEVRRIAYGIEASWLQWFTERGKYLYVALCRFGLRSLPSQWLWPVYTGRPMAPAFVPESFEWGRPRLSSELFPEGLRSVLRLPLMSCGLPLNLLLRRLDSGVWSATEPVACDALRLDGVKDKTLRRYA